MSKRTGKPPKNAKRFLVVSEDGHEDFVITARELCAMTGTTYNTAFRRLSDYSKKKIDRKRLFSGSGRVTQVDGFTHKGTYWSIDDVKSEVHGLSFFAASLRVQRFAQKLISFDTVFEPLPAYPEPKANMRFIPMADYIQHQQEVSA